MNKKQKIINDRLNNNWLFNHYVIISTTNISSNYYISDIYDLTDKLNINLYNIFWFNFV